MASSNNNPNSRSDATNDHSLRDESINDISLFEGASVLLPDRPMALYGDDYPDEISSLNSSIYRSEHSLTGFTNGNFDLRIAGRNDDSSGGGGGGEGPVVPDTFLQKNESQETNDTSRFSHSSPIQNNNSSSQNPKRCWCCCRVVVVVPNWYHRAPSWLQIVVMFSVALLVGSAVLVAVGLTLAFRDSSSSSTAADSSSKNQESILNGDDEYIPATPGFSTLPPQSPPQEEEEEEEQFFATSAPTFPPRIRSPTVSPTPTAAPTAAPSPTPTTMPSPSPTSPINSEVIKFYVTAGRYESDLLENAPENLKKLPKRAGTSFLVHLGDWNNPDTCDESSFQQVVDLYQSSSVPVYFVVGDQEFTNCSDPEQAMELWKNNLVNYETMYWEQPSWDIWRQGQGYEENFAFDYNMDVVFASINLVGEKSSIEQDEITPEFEVEYELDDRLQANLDWIDELYKDYRKQASMFFIFSNAGPRTDGPNKPFFDALFDQIQTRYAQMRFVLVHRNRSQPERYGIEKNYDKIESLDVISVLGPIWPPLEITVDTRETDPSEAVSISLHEWYDSL